MQVIYNPMVTICTAWFNNQQFFFPLVSVCRYGAEKCRQCFRTRRPQSDVCVWNLSVDEPATRSLCRRVPSCRLHSVSSSSSPCSRRDQYSKPRPILKNLLAKLWWWNILHQPMQSVLIPQPVAQTSLAFLHKQNISVQHPADGKHFRFVTATTQFWAIRLMKVEIKKTADSPMQIRANAYI